jgi:hypothetical protein
MGTEASETSTAMFLQVFVAMVAAVSAVAMLAAAISNQRPDPTLYGVP